MGLGHGGEGFNVACGAIGEDAFDKDGGEAQAAVGGVDDDARDGADVAVDEAQAGLRGEDIQIQCAIAGAAATGARWSSFLSHPVSVRSKTRTKALCPLRKCMTTAQVS